ncbi:uncharacterized protein ACBT57_023509 [Dama dama]
MLGCAWSHLEKLQKSRLGPLPSVSDSPGPEQGLRTAFLASFQLGPRSRPGTTLRASLDSSFRAEDANWPRGSVWGRRWARKRTQGNICKNKMDGPKCLPVARDKDRASLFTGKSGDGPRSRLRELFTLLDGDKEKQIIFFKEEGENMLSCLTNMSDELPNSLSHSAASVTDSCELSSKGESQLWHEARLSATVKALAAAALERHWSDTMVVLCEVTLWRLRQLLRQPGKRLRYGCHARQERRNISAVPVAPRVFFQPLSSSLA